jgi:hypothetical protein
MQRDRQKIRTGRGSLTPEERLDRLESPSRLVPGGSVLRISTRGPIGGNPHTHPKKRRADHLRAGGDGGRRAGQARGNRPRLVDRRSGTNKSHAAAGVKPPVSGVG